MVPLKKFSHHVIKQLFKNPPHGSTILALPMEVRACLSETLSHKLLNPLRFKHIMSNLLAYVDNEMSPSDFITKARKEYM